MDHKELEAVLEGINRTVYIAERCWAHGADAGLLLMTRFPELVHFCEQPLITDEHFMAAVHAACAENEAAGLRVLDRMSI